MITGVILNWKRPDNVTRILTNWQSGGLVSEAIVWNNHAAAPFRHSWAKVINAGQDLGLYTRFAAACLAQSDCVLIQDDDLELPLATLQRLFEAWKNQPDILHGIFGRAPKPDGSYARNVMGDAEVPIVLTRVLVAHRRYAARFFSVASQFADLQEQSQPLGNGEDILFSYVARLASGRLNRVHKLPVKELPAPHSIHGRNWKQHIDHRSRLLRACENWLKGASHEGSGDLLHLQKTA